MSEVEHPFVIFVFEIYISFPADFLYVFPVILLVYFLFVYMSPS